MDIYETKCSHFPTCNYCCPIKQSDCIHFEEKLERAIIKCKECGNWNRVSSKFGMCKRNNLIQNEEDFCSAGKKENK